MDKFEYFKFNLYVVKYYKFLNYITFFRTISLIMLTFSLTSENSWKNIRNKYTDYK